MPPTFPIVCASLGLDDTTTARLWDALSRSHHPLARRVYWLFATHTGRKARRLVDRFTVLLVGQTLRDWSRMLEALVATERLTRGESNTVLECLLPLVDSQGQWR